MIVNKLMKRLLTLFLLIASTKTLLACCGSLFVDVYPKGVNIAANSVFLITFAESDFKLKDKLACFSFYAVTLNGKKIKLNPLQINFSGTQGQILLQSSQNFKPGDSISISFKPARNTTDSLSTYLKEVIEQKRWFVSAPADNEPPIWQTDSILTIFYDSRNSSAHGFGFGFDCPLTDNSIPQLTYTAYGNNYYPVFYEISLSGERHICAGDEFKPFVSWGMCGRNFSPLQTKSDVVSIRPLDYSGNYAQSKNAEIKIPVKE